MTAYPRDLSKRFAQTFADLLARVKMLESRTAGIDSGATLAALPAVVEQSYTSGNPSVYINGSAALSGPFPYLASYSPAAGDSVLVLPLPATVYGPGQFVILGKI